MFCSVSEGVGVNIIGDPTNTMEGVGGRNSVERFRGM